MKQKSEMRKYRKPGNKSREVQGDNPFENVNQ
jgi:hypothetical protein